MANELWTALTPAGERFSEEADLTTLLLATDFDGSIAEIVDDPEAARMHQGCAEALAVLGARVARLAIITGRGVETVRRLGELDTRTGFESAIVLGHYGVERWNARLGTVVGSEAPETVRGAIEDLQALLAASPSLADVWLEDKGCAVGVHTRRVSDPVGTLDDLAGPIAEIAERHALHVEPGKFVFELRASSLTKGDALRSLVDELAPAGVVMIGDDLGDLPAFEALHDLRDAGLTCCAVLSASGERPALRAVSDVVCEGPTGVAGWLDALARR